MKYLSNHAHGKTVRSFTALVACLTGLFAIGALAQKPAEPVGPIAPAGPGRGDTAKLEVAYLQFIIDHHFTGLRVTELAAGTDLTRNPELAEREGTSPTPGFPAIEAGKAQLPDVISMSRKANRAQREEIVKAQKFLREWYGVTYEPSVLPEMRGAIDQLEQTTGPEFDRLFLQVYATHNFVAATQTVSCIAGRDVAHQELLRYCGGMLVEHTNEVDESRDLLCKNYQDCGFVPAGVPLMGGPTGGGTPGGGMPGGEPTGGESRPQKR